MSNPVSNDSLQHVQFGVAGNPPNFWESAYRKDRGYAPAWLREIGLDALEIQCTYGVRMPDKRAALFKEQSEEHNISLSLHAPYYVTLGTDDPHKRENSLRDLRKSIELAKKLGSRRVVFHPGSAHGDRRNALDRAIQALRFLEADTDFGEVEIYPEIAGKAGQLGSLDDILELCAEIEKAWPCLDLAHLDAREGGSLVHQEDFESVFDRVASSLGPRALSKLHFHMYPVKWGPKGETGHVRFDETMEPMLSTEGDEPLQPPYKPFIDMLVARNLSATVICEARDSQDVGALAMKEHFESSQLGG
ncbi:TIM barrel protein [Candidatus Bipolaricaulota bacterium]